MDGCPRPPAGTTGRRRGRRAGRRAVRRRATPVVAGGLLALACAACSESGRLSLRAGSGPDPVLPAPRTPLLPPVEIAPAVGWPRGAAPTQTGGWRVTRFAEGLSHPRWPDVLPDGDVLVANDVGNAVWRLAWAGR